MLVASGEVLTHRKYGEHYHSLVLVAPDIARDIRPGQFVNIRCGDDRSYMLRRPFSVYRVQKRDGWASTIEIVFDIRGPGTRYLSALQGHEHVDLVGPLGRGFSLPRRPARCVLVGGGIGATPLFFLADELRAAGHRVEFILGARTVELLLNPIDARRVATAYSATTEDGSQGQQGRVTDVLPEAIERGQIDGQDGPCIVYSCGPHPMLAAVARICVERDVAVEVAVEELMACGYGVCMTCVMPLRGKSRGRTFYARSCTEGPVFNAAQVVWDGSTEAVGAEERELAPAAAPVRHGALSEPEHEHPPPGN